MITDTGAVVVDVKPQHRLANREGFVEFGLDPHSRQRAGMALRGRQ